MDEILLFSYQVYLCLFEVSTYSITYDSVGLSPVIDK